MTPTAPDWGSLLPALLDFERSPGRYPVLLREPRPLFEQTLTVLQLAAGRSVDGLADLAQDPAQTDELRRAARFFVRTVLLRPGVDHYTLLGLAPGCEAAELREHYRLMIRLTHPDFAAGGGEAWPADAATRINQANDVLASPERRADYNATLVPAGVSGVSGASGSASAGGSAGFGGFGAAGRATADAASGGFGAGGVGAAPAGAGHAVLAPRAGLAPKRLKKDAAGEGWRVPRGAKIALASLGALAAAAALVMGNPAGDSGSLTVRKQPTVPNPTLQAETGLRLVGDAAREAQVEPQETVRTELHSVRTEPVEVLAQRKTTFDKLRMNGNTGSARTGKEASDGPSGSAVEAGARAWAQDGDSGETALSLMMDTRMAPPVVAMPVSMVVAAAPVAPAPVKAAAAAPASPAEPAPTLAQVQPALSNLMGSLPGARGENMAYWIDADFRAHPDTGRFVSRFNQLLAGQRVTQLGEVRFSSRTQGAQLVVDGMIKLHTLDTAEQARVRDLHLRAFFQPHEGRTVLTQLVAGPLQ